MWRTKHLVSLALVQLLSLTNIVPSSSHLQFVNEPMSRLVKVSEGRAVFRCDASPPGSIIRWLHNGHPVLHNRWIKVAGQKLTVLLGKMENVTSVAAEDMQPPQSDHYFQCEIRFRGKALVSAPAKLIVATLDQFPNQPDVHISAFFGNTAVIPCDPPYSIPTVITEFLFNETTITRSIGNRHLMDSGDLQIFNVGHQDAGEYICVANNPFLAEKVISKRKIILHVIVSWEPKATTITKSPRSKVSVAYGSNITLECAAAGNPPPTITWRKHQGKMLHERHQIIGGNLHLIGVRREDGGKYLCQAQNRFGNLETRSAELEIQETPQILKSLKNVNLEVGENLTLTCQVRGHPKPSLRWFHNGKEMVSEYKKSHLVIPSVGHKHSGIYQCLATNDLGTTYEFAMVSVTSGNESSVFDDRDEYNDYDSDDSSHHDKHKSPSSVDQDANEDSKFDSGRDSHGSKPYSRKRHKKKHSKGVKLIPPSKPDITRLSNTSVMVRWTVGNGGLPINFFKVQYKEVGKRKSDWMTIDEDIASHIHSYAVTSLRTGGAYRFRIAAVYSNHDNKAGPISTKFVLYKDPPMEKPSIGPIINFAEAVSPSAITLHWEYNDADSVTIEGFFIHYRATHTAGKYLKVTVLGSNTRSHIISHLLPDTGYDIKMQCFNIAGTSDFSNIYTSKTKVSENPALTRNRNSRPNQDDDIIMSDVNADSSTASDNSNLLYIIIGGVVGVVVVACVCCGCLVVRQRKGRRRHRDHVSDRENHHKTGNGHIATNGYIPVANKININVNPLSHLNMESTEKIEELQDIVSNNNEIIRLQTFSANTAQQEPLLTGDERESSMNDNDKASSVIIQSNDDSHSDLPTDL